MHVCTIVHGFPTHSCCWSKWKRKATTAEWCITLVSIPLPVWIIGWVRWLDYLIFPASNSWNTWPDFKPVSSVGFLVAATHSASLPIVVKLSKHFTNLKRSAKSNDMKQQTEYNHQQLLLFKPYSLHVFLLHETTYFFILNQSTKYVSHLLVREW